MVSSDIYIIKATSYRESSNMYEAVAKDYGKVTLIHKGVKSNRKNNPLELFTNYRVHWSGKGNIKYLRDYENLERINFSYKHNIIGMYYNELLYYLTKNDYHIEALYSHYDESLKSLMGSTHLFVELNNYEIGLLILAGHYLIFEHDSDNQFIDKSKKYSYIPDVGPKISVSNNGSYMGETLLALSGNFPYNEISIKESRVLMKRLIDYYIQPKKIKTREILKYISL